MLQGFRNRNSAKLFLCLMIALLFCLAMPLCALAGNGDGSGGGKTTDFALASSDPADGSIDVALDKDIVLLFNKNVVNTAVRDNNLQCFTLKDASGDTVPITVNMVDDQVDPTYKRYITVSPDEKLVASSKYTLTISGDLQAKSGSSLENPVSISFTTLADKAAAASTTSKTTDQTADKSSNKTSDTSGTPADKPSSANVQEEEPVSSTDTPTETVPPDSNAAADAQRAEADNSQTDQNSEKEEASPSRPAYVIVIWAVVIAFIVYIFVTRRKKK